MRLLAARPVRSSLMAARPCREANEDNWEAQAASERRPREEKGREAVVVVEEQPRMLWAGLGKGETIITPDVVVERWLSELGNAAREAGHMGGGEKGAHKDQRLLLWRGPRRQTSGTTTTATTASAFAAEQMRRILARVSVETWGAHVINNRCYHSLGIAVIAVS